MNEPANEPIALAAHGLCVGYGNKTVVAGVDFDVHPGQALALVGTNGSGKSTLLKTIVGLLKPVAGDLTVMGENGAANRPGRLSKRIAYLGQFHASSALLPLSVSDVVMMGRYAHRGLLGRMSADDHEAVAEAMERVWVTDLAQRAVHSLSGGQRQRVYLAQVLAKRADLIVLDEPTSGLDVRSSQRYLEIVREELARGATVVTATHDISEAQSCDQAVLLAGRVVASGTPAEVLNADRLLEAFGIALLAVPHANHEDLVTAELPHAHDHDHHEDHSHRSGRLR